MRWKQRKYRDFDEKWHQWFAWYPIKANGDWIWWEIVLRRGRRCFQLIKNSGSTPNENDRTH